MTPRFFTSFILVNIFKIPTNLFLTLIRFLRKTSAIAVATLAGAVVGMCRVGLDVVVAVVGGQGPEIVRGQGYSPVKQKTKHNALGIDLVLKSSAGVVVGMCRVGWMWQLQWWEARGWRSCGAGGIRLRNRKSSAMHSVLI